MRATLSMMAICLAMSLLLIQGSAGPALSGEKGKKKAKNPLILDPSGEPKKANKGAAHFAVWHDHKGWRLQTIVTPKSGPHRFRGIIKVEGGTITKLQSNKLEKKSTPLEDHWSFDPVGKQLIAFDFRTKVFDGIIFEVSPTATAITFDLGIDLQSVPALVVVGHKAAHPATIPFALPAHAPGDGKKKKGGGN